MEIQIINHKSKWLAPIQSLGDTASATVGFLARDVYYDYARKGHILAVTEGEQLLAYTMFRFKKNSIVIVQLCVDPHYRGQNIPAKMLDWLLEQNKDYISHLQLACRRDFHLEKFWQKLGFSAIGEKAGRATRARTILTIWVKENHECKDLFASLSEVAGRKSLVVLDTNIIIDLCDNSNTESSYLLQGYLGTYADFRITKYVASEINHSSNPNVRNRHRDYAVEHYFTLDNVDDALFQEVKNELLRKRFAVENSNMWYDIVHIAQAIAAGAEVFITRDGGCLNNEFSTYIEQRFGLHILSPGEFINSIDELTTPYDYSPLKLAGLGLEYSKLSNTDYSSVISTFYQQYGKKTLFEQQLRQWMATSAKYTVLLIKSYNIPVCLIVYAVQDGAMSIDTILINRGKIKPSLYNTFIKRIAFKLLDEAHHNKVCEIKISKQGVSNDMWQIFRDCGYFENIDSLLRIIKPGIFLSKSLQLIDKLPLTSPLNIAIQRLIENQQVGSTSPEQIVSLEKAMWPIKLSGTGVPCFIVPIKADYAVQLFDENLYNQEFSLFENDKPEPALSIENAYFKAEKHSIPQAPARILWYVSSSHYIGTPSIRACSYLDRVEKGPAKELFDRYRRLGVLEWKDLQSLSAKGNVATYIFSYTELFESPIGLDQTRVLINKPAETFQSYCAIDEDTFMHIYQEGTQGDNHAR